MARPRTTTPAEPAVEPTEPFAPGGLVKAAEPIELPAGTPIKPLPPSTYMPNLDAIRTEAYEKGYREGTEDAKRVRLPLFEEAKRIAATLAGNTEQSVRSALVDLQDVRAEQLTQADLDLILVTWRRAHQAAANRAPAAPKPTRAAGTPRTEQEIRDATTYETVR